ncbi:MAG: DUF2017 family protein [Verrucomicrobiota bacterium]|nr:DUF2017 family protein [Verrucomicrobiota bacterium]
MEIGDLDILCVELLRQILPSADVDDNPAGRARLFTSPTAGREPDLDRDWQSYVEPDLRELFQSSLDVIRADLESLPAKVALEFAALRIPVKHLEPWIQGLNQARLALAAKYDFTERDMEGIDPDAGDARAFALFQIHFYGFLQECFLRELRR